MFEFESGTAVNFVFNKYFPMLLSCKLAELPPSGNTDGRERRERRERVSRAGRQRDQRRETGWIYNFFHCFLLTLAELNNVNIFLPSI